MGKMASIEDIVREYRAPLARHLQRQVGDPSVAEDLLQETFIRAARSLGNFEGRSSLKTWLYAIAGNVVVDYLRKPAQRQHIVDLDEAAELEDDDLAVDERMVIDEMNACVRQVIDSLPADYRTALILHDLEDMDGAQTAEVLGLSQGAARVRIHRARARLKAALQESCGFYRDSNSVLRCTRRD